MPGPLSVSCYIWLWLRTGSGAPDLKKILDPCKTLTASLSTEPLSLNSCSHIFTVHAQTVFGAKKIIETSGVWSRFHMGWGFFLNHPRSQKYGTNTKSYIKDYTKVSAGTGCDIPPARALSTQWNPDFLWGLHISEDTVCDVNMLLRMHVVPNGRRAWFTCQRFCRHSDFSVAAPYASYYLSYDFHALYMDCLNQLLYPEGPTIHYILVWRFLIQLADT